MIADLVMEFRIENSFINTPQEDSAFKYNSYFVKYCPFSSPLYSSRGFKLAELEFYSERMSYKSLSLGKFYGDKSMIV